MAAPKRNGPQREQDLVDIAAMYCKGYSMRKMAVELARNRKYSLSHKQVNYDVDEILKRWREQTVKPIEEYKAEELKKTNHLEQVYWEAWERSLEARKISATEINAHKDDKGKQLPSRAKTLKREEETYGDPRFLQGVQWCIERRCKIMGIDAPERREDVGKPQIVIHRGPLPETPEPNESECV